MPEVWQEVYWQNGDVEDDRWLRFSRFCVCLHGVWRAVGEGGHPENRRKKDFETYLRVPFVPISYKSERVGTVKSGKAL